MTRKRISEAVKRQVLTEAGFLCANPRCRNPLAVELHHIVWVKDGGGNDPGNLLALCAYCHELHNKGVIPRYAIERWKLALQALSDALDRDALDLMLLMKKHSEEVHWPLYVSGDGILRLARLINAGLVDMRFSQGSSGGGAAPYSMYMPELTDRGETVVNAWRAGDIEGLRSALQGEQPGGEQSSVRESTS